MLIEVKKESSNRLADILKAIISLSNDQAKELIGTIDADFINIKDNGLEIKYVTEDKEIIVPVCTVLQYIEERINDYDKDSREYKLLRKFLNSRSRENFFQAIKTKEGKAFSNDVAERALMILASDELTEQFMAIPADSVDRAYFEQFFRLLFYTKGNSDTALAMGFNIKDIKTILKNLKQIEKQIKQGKGSYRFAAISDSLLETDGKMLLTAKHVGSHEIIRKSQEPEWTIDEELEEAILMGMPEGITPEEQAMYIYINMCKILKYDEGAKYRHATRGKNIVDRVNYTSEFSAEHLSKIKTTSRVTCFDFSRIFIKIANEHIENLEAVILNQFNGHFCVGFSTARCSVKLEPINMFKAEGEKYSTDDMERTKSGHKPAGVFPIYDPNNIIEKALKKMYPKVVNTRKRGLNDLVAQLIEIPEEPVDMDLKDTLTMLVKHMKKSSITGNEFTIRFNNIFNNSWLRKKLMRRYIGKPVFLAEDDLVYRRIIWLREKIEQLDPKQGEVRKPEMYLIDTDTMEIRECTDKEMLSKIESGEFVYESDKLQMPGFEK